MAGDADVHRHHETPEGARRATTPPLNEPPQAPVFSLPQVSMPLLPCRGDAPFDPMRPSDGHRRANGRTGSSFSAASWTSTVGNSTVPQSKAHLQCERPCPYVLRYRATAIADRPRSSMRARCPRSRETSPPPSSGTCLVGPRRSLDGSANAVPNRRSMRVAVGSMRGICAPPRAAAMTTVVRPSIGGWQARLGLLQLVYRNR